MRSQTVRTRASARSRPAVSLVDSRTRCPAAGSPHGFHVGASRCQGKLGDRPARLPFALEVQGGVLSRELPDCVSSAAKLWAASRGKRTRSVHEPGTLEPARRSIVPEIRGPRTGSEAEAYSSTSEPSGGSRSRRFGACGLRSLEPARRSKVPEIRGPRTESEAKAYSSTPKPSGGSRSRRFGASGLRSQPWRMG